VLAHHDLVAEPDRDRVLELGSDRQYRWHRVTGTERERSVAPSAPKDLEAPSHDARDRIIDRSDDLSVVGEEDVREPPKSGTGFFISDTDRFVG
jgi:hypothetical protein